MSSRRSWCVAAIIVSSSVVACATGGRAGGGAGDGQALVRQWEAAARSRDASALAALYAEDAVGLYADAPAVQGRDSIRVTWERFFRDNFIEVMPRRIDVAASNDLAYTTGRYQVRQATATGPLLEEGKYVQVWKKVNGEWRVVVDINNSDGARP